MKDNSDVGVASCKVIGFDNELQPNGGDLPLGLALINWLFNLEVLGIERPSFHRVESEYYNSVHQVGWVSGNFMIIRTEALKKAGYFDSDYFMYFEDVDLFYMMAESGYKVMINPDVRIKHLSGGSLDHPQFRQWKGEFWGLIHFYRKRFGFLSGLIISTLVYISILLRILAFAAIGKFEYSKTYAKVFASI